MRHLVIGIPARNEASTIVALCDALESGAALLGEVATVELVLAYQDSEDDTLARFVERPGRLPWRVLRCPSGTEGKGRNVKLLIEAAVHSRADLLLVDGDMRDYRPGDVARFVARGYDRGWDSALPLWCRPWGHANVTNYLAAPLLVALYATQIRQPLAGQRFLANAWLQQAPRDLPDDYGIDLALTMAVLDSGGQIGQVLMPWIDHDARQLNSQRILQEVASTALRRVQGEPFGGRSDLRPPDGYEQHLSWPPQEPDTTRPGRALATPATTQAAWLDALSAAVTRAREGADAEILAAGLVEPFFAHVEARRSNPRPDVPVAESYVWALGEMLRMHLG
jgi:hypothetical protein